MSANWLQYRLLETRLLKHLEMDRQANLPHLVRVLFAARTKACEQGTHDAMALLCACLLHEVGGNPGPAALKESARLMRLLDCPPESVVIAQEAIHLLPTPGKAEMDGGIEARALARAHWDNGHNGRHDQFMSASLLVKRGRVHAEGSADLVMRAACKHQVTMNAPTGVNA